MILTTDDDTFDSITLVRGGFNISNENSFITQSTNALGLNAICKTKAQSAAAIMVDETLNLISYRHLKKHINIHCICFLPNCEDSF